MGVPDMTDSVSVSLNECEKITIVENISTPFMSMFAASLTGEASVTLYTPRKNIVLEDHDYNVTTEDGDSNITTE